jgi:hypothetical protein
MESLSRWRSRLISDPPQSNLAYQWRILVEVTIANSLRLAQGSRFKCSSAGKTREPTGEVKHYRVLIERVTTPRIEHPSASPSSVEIAKEDDVAVGIATGQQQPLSV